MDPPVDPCHLAHVEADIMLQWPAKLWAAKLDSDASLAFHQEGTYRSKRLENAKTRDDVLLWIKDVWSFVPSAKGEARTLDVTGAAERS